jgi:hypothetical protein
MLLIMLNDNVDHNDMLIRFTNLNFNYQCILLYSKHYT